jgi:hypothetical protein
MTELTPELEAIGRRLQLAYGARLRRRRIIRVTAATFAAFAVLATAAFASGIAGDLNLDPTQWDLISSGAVDNGQAQYVHAKRIKDGSHSTFMVEHDATMTDRYDAFLLHEKVKAEANATSPVPVKDEPGPLCSREQLTTVEQTALDALRAGNDAGAAVSAAFADDPCRGEEYGTEIASRVFAGKEPTGHLLPGVG